MALPRVSVSFKANTGPKTSMLVSSFCRSTLWRMVGNAGFETAIDQLLNALLTGGGDDGAHVDGLVESIADLQFGGDVQDGFLKRLVSVPSGDGKPRRRDSVGRHNRRRYR